MKRIIIKFYLKILLLYLSLFYDKKFLQGKVFSKDHYTYGWRMALYAKKSQKKGINKSVPWPCNPSTIVLEPHKIKFDIDYIDNFFNIGCYYQGTGGISIGKRTQIAANVGIITSNHNPENVDEHLQPKEVIIGDDCWIGMNSMILPGVELGNHTVVGAGSVVTKSFPEGHCIIAGNPAKVIRNF